MSAVYDLADVYCERMAALDPAAATEAGLPGHDAELTDYSPAGCAARDDEARRTLETLRRLPAETDRDRIAAEMMAERLEIDLDVFAAGEHLRDLNVIASPVQGLRSWFDLMPTATNDDCEVIAARLEAIPGAVANYEDALRAGARQGMLAARRQAEGAAAQALAWAGADGSGGFFASLVAECGAASPDLRERLDRAAVQASAAYVGLGRFLLDEYGGAERDAVGRDRYGLLARAYTGLVLDLDETYAWGWEELHRIEDRMRAVADRIVPGAPVEEVTDLLESDPARAIEGVDAFRGWMQELQDRTISELDGRHFDIAPPVQRLEVMIAPPGGSAAMYYTGPSEDFSRPGRTWYPTLGETRFPLWHEVSTCYHEGVPGHHLQVAQVRYLAGELSRFQRTFAWVSGHGEGWALYAERLMGELGYLENADYELGMLREQALRAARVVIDIGMHLELAIPPSESFHPGERWTPQLGLEFVLARASHSERFVRSEIDRYLGWPGQAISYKVGERVWLECRDDARRRAGAAFDLKDFHTRALDLGCMGLDQLRRELARL